ncbi:protein kinase [Nonomuraea antimicrobica]
MPGDLYLLAGRYRLIERLGQGGAGTVWRAIDETLDRQVAVKQVRVPEGLTSREHAEFADQAIHEARSAGRLRDPAIVLVHDVVLEGGQPWIIMDLVTGRSLDKVIKAQGPLPRGSWPRSGCACCRRWRSPTPTASCTRTSNRQTSCSTPTAPPCSPTSASPRR